MVFNQFAQVEQKRGPKSTLDPVEPHISLKVFKENFVNTMRFKREDALFGIIKAGNLSKSSKDTGAESDGFSSHAPSMLPDHILEGKRYADIKKQTEDRQKELEKIRKQKLAAVMEDPDENERPRGGDTLSQADSQLSVPLSRIMGAQGGDPRKKFSKETASPTSGTKGHHSALNAENLQKLADQMPGSIYNRQLQVCLPLDGT